MKKFYVPIWLSSCYVASKLVRFLLRNTVFTPFIFNTFFDKKVFIHHSWFAISA